MQTPYEILGITDDTSDDVIKQAYLRQVKKNPPDRDQEKFQQIHTAYLSIKDRKSRVSHDLFTFPTANFEGLLNQVLKTEQAMMLNAESFKKILTGSVDETEFVNVFTRHPKK